MHRRAQAAEGRLEAALFWATSIEDWAVKNREHYIREIAGIMVRELTRHRAPKLSDKKEQSDG